MNTATVQSTEGTIGDAHNRVLEELKNVPSEHQRFEGRGLDAQIALQKELLKGREVKDKLKEAVAFLKNQSWIPAQDIAEKLLKLPEDVVPLVRKMEVLAPGKFPRAYTKIDLKFVEPDSLEKVKEALELPLDSRKLLTIPQSPQECGYQAEKGAQISYSLVASPTDRSLLMRELLQSATQEKWAVDHADVRTQVERYLARCGAVLRGATESLATYSGVVGLSFGFNAVRCFVEKSPATPLLVLMTAVTGFFTLYHVDAAWNRISRNLDAVKRQER